MAGLISSIVGGVAQLGGAIYGAVASAQNNEKARALIQEQRDDNRNWRNTEMAKDYTMRSDAQAVMNRQRELLDEKYKQARATNAVAGGTDESLALQKEAANNAMAQTMGDIAANASNYKDSVDRQFRQQDAQLNQQQVQNYEKQGEQAAQAAAQVVNSGSSLMGSGVNALLKSKAGDDAIIKSKP